MNNRVLVWIHSIILLLCLYVICCCGFHVLPAWGVSEHYETINSSLLSIALSYFAGFIIYILTSVIPRKQRESEVFSLWKPHLSKLYNEMSERIEEVRTFLDIPKERMKELTIEDCKPFENYTELSSVISIDKSIVKENPKRPLHIGTEFSIKKHLNNHHNEVLNIISVMIDNPMAIDADKKILDILSLIKASNFLKECNRIIDSSQLGAIHPHITHSDLPKAFCEYVKLRDQLGLLPIPKDVYNMRKRSDEEVQKVQKTIEEQLSKMGLTQEMALKFGQIITEASKR